MKLAKLIIKLLSALSLLVESAANLYHAVRNGAVHLITEIKKHASGDNKK